MKHASHFIKEIRREDFWIAPFTVMAIILGCYAATSQKMALWIMSGCLIAGMFVFTTLLIAHKYNRHRGLVHIIFASILLVIAIRVGITLM